MKVQLPDIESQFPNAVMDEAADLVRQTTEYTLMKTGEGQFQLVATTPSYLVELSILPEQLLQTKCQCAAFQRSKECFHALAATLIYRTEKMPRLQKRKKKTEDLATTDEVIRKMKVTDLRQFIHQYAKTHHAFRVELLANSLYLTKNPDYNALLAMITPMDRFGQAKINRNSIKSVRHIIGILLKQATDLFREKSLPETISMVSAILLYLQRLMLRYPAFQSVLMSDYKSSWRLFESIARLEMAPRLQDTMIRFAIEMTERDSYVIPMGHRSLLRSVDHFVHDVKTKTILTQIVIRKSAEDTIRLPDWLALLWRWKRLWKITIPPDVTKKIDSGMNELTMLQYAHQDFEDVVYAVLHWPESQKQHKQYPHILTTAIKAAQETGDVAAGKKLALESVTLHHNTESLVSLYQLDRDQAVMVLQRMANRLELLDETEITFLLEGLIITDQQEKLTDILLHSDNPEHWLTYDMWLAPENTHIAVDFYARHIQQTRSRYGGVMARERLNTIFGHLKANGLYSAVVDKIKQMEGKATAEPHVKQAEIKGFVFDLDGVIVDTAIHHFNGWKKLMHEIGVEIEEEDDHHTRGASRMESLSYLLTKYNLAFDEEEKLRLADRKNGYYLESIESITPYDLLPGTAAFLHASREKGLKLALGSASKNAKGVLEKLGITSMFDAILDGHSAKESKPHPEIFVKACEALQLPADQVVVFEDAAKGVQAAIGAGCHVVGIGSEDTLRDADLVIAGFDNTTPSAIIAQII